MIPATYPSILDSSNRTKMLVYQVPSIVGLTRWIDYIPVKSPASESDLTLANTFANEGFILTSKVNDITGLVPFKDYVPIYLDSTATKAWSADNDGYIPMAELAGLLLDFTTGSLDARINFSRTTNATITNSAGQITYAPHNLLTYSEQFDNAAWSKNTLTVTANNSIAPNGTTTADLITVTAGSATKNIAQGMASSNPFTISIYAKAGTHSYIQLLVQTGSGGYVNFDLTNGTFSATTASGTITSVGNGWYRCTMSLSGVAATVAYVAPVASLSSTRNETWTAVGTETFYLWGAQAEIGSTATTYNSTTVKNLLGYSELFDNAAWTKSNSFVQTNLLTYSEAFDNAAWAKTTITATANSIAAPNGYQTADTLLATGANSTALQTFTASAVPYTFSVYLYRKTGTGNIDITVDGTTWVTKAITAGWTRFDTTLTPAAGSKTAGIRIVTSGDEVYAWGAQLVQGSDAGAYRRTDSASLPCYYPNYNGVVCAEKLVDNTVNIAHSIQQAANLITNTPYTFSCYGKKGELSYLWIRVNDTTANQWAWFNLNTGVVGTVNAGITANITSVGNGYYRCSVTRTSAGTGAGSFYVGVSNADNITAYTGDGTSGIYIFGAQLSDSASLDPYVLNAAAAPTAAAYYGARFDYDPVTLAPKGLLIEEQRSNLLVNSSILGTLLSTQSVTVTAVAHTLSFYGTGTVTITGTYIGSLVGSGAYPTRSTLTFTPTAGVILLTVTGDVQFAQLEIGSFATSFIPTAASQVTRAADVATIQGSNFYSWYNQNEGTLSLSAKTAPAGAFYLMLNSTAFTTNSTYIDISSGSYRGVNFYNGVNTVAITGGSAGAVGTDKKVAFGYKKDDFAESVSGANAVTDTSAEVSTQIIKLEIGSAAGAGYINTTIKSISYYPQRLSDSVLKGLTA